MDEIGETLRLARESSGLSLEEVSKDLNIKIEILENIEAGKVGAFKDIFELKGYIELYGKYLGLDIGKLIDDFNEYMFNYTSKIPVKEIEKTIELKIKSEDKKNEIVSPYTKEPKKKYNFIQIVILILIVIMIIGVVIWAKKQIPIGDTVTAMINN